MLESSIFLLNDFFTTMIAIVASEGIAAGQTGLLTFHLLKIMVLVVRETLHQNYQIEQFVVMMIN